MSKTVLNYVFNSQQLANPDGSLPATCRGCTVVPGPGQTPLGSYANALSFGSAGKAQVDLPVAQLSTQKFCVRTVIKADAPVIARQNLVESAAIPFALFLNPIAGSNDFKAVVSVAPKAHGWAGATTEFAMPLKVGTWYVVDLVYDTDTVGVAIDGNVLAVAAFPDGMIETGAPKLCIATWIDGVRDHFSGCMAALQVHNGIPEALEARLDERRNSPEWFITYKYQEVKSKIGLGAALGSITYDAASGGYTQLYDGGLIMYADEIGAAFEMHGAIFNTYKAFANKAQLGYLASDEIDASVSGSRKSVFSEGAIYWSGATGAVPVVDKIYLDYAAMGDASFIGLPVALATDIPNGKQQTFQRAQMYHKTGQPKAHEVHGAILDRFIATGGVQAWGFPISNEQDVKKDNQVVGRSSDFENGTFYWRSGIGAFEVHGAIRDKYRSLNGPISALGFPTSDEVNIPGAAAPARANSFQNGSILWFGSGGTFVCQNFKIRIGRMSTQDSEGPTMGQNDLYFRVIVEDNGHTLLNKRFPDSSDYDGRDIVEINQALPLTLVPNNLNSKIKITFDIWESDNGAPFGEGDDHLGTKSHVLNAANAWGLRENQGIMNTGAFGLVNSVTWSVQPEVNIATLTEAQQWWGPAVRNRGTPSLSYTQYGAGFRDIDPTPEDWDLTDWLDKAFYELVVEDIAAGGNCFGMSLEGIYARKNRSLLSMPLDRFNNWNTVVNEFNVKHEYQVGAAPIWWFVGQFLSGKTHNPVDVFHATRDALARGDHPVVCLSQNYDFSGAPHCVMAAGHDSNTKPWKLEIRDPNFVSGNVVRFIEIDPDNNTFHYNSGSLNYSGSEWSGGRLHYLPYSILNERPRTPIWDAIMLLLGGVILILGKDAQTENLTDEAGVDLSAFGPDTIARLKERKSVANKLVPFCGYNGNRATASEFYLRTQPKTSFMVIHPGDARLGANITFGELARNNALPVELREVARDARLFNAMAGRDIKSLVHDGTLTAALGPAAVTAMKNLAAQGTAGKNIRHKLKGKNNGQLQYVGKCRLTTFALTAPIVANESLAVSIDDFGTPSSVLVLKSPTSKLAKVEISNRLGASEDSIKIVIDKLPVEAAKDLRVNVKPGMGGVDILSATPGAHPELTIEANIDGKRSKAEYTIPFDGGIRIRPSTMLSNRELQIGKIDNLFGRLRDGSLLKPRA